MTPDADKTEELTRFARDLWWHQSTATWRDRWDVLSQDFTVEDLKKEGVSEDLIQRINTKWCPGLFDFSRSNVDRIHFDEAEEEKSGITFEDLHQFLTGESPDGELLTSDSSEDESLTSEEDSRPEAQEEIKPNPYSVESWWYCVVDGDHIGNQAAIPLLSDDEEKASRISKLIHRGQDYIDDWVHHRNGVVILDGGDNAVFKFKQKDYSKLTEFHEMLQELREGYKELTGFTLSVGVGAKLSEADKSLLVAKYRGRDRIVHYVRDVEDDFEKAKESASDEDKLKKEIGL